jgi:exodeoxyribonuclease V alpha subunit
MATEELTGEVASVVFVNAATGFGVVELAASSDDGPRASGPLAGLVPGQAVRLLGRWTEHTRYGPTFEAVAYEHARPRSADGLVAFLSSERFLGVGETLAARIVTRFGLDVGAVIEAEPGRLAEVKGVSTALAAAIGDAWREAGALAALLAELTAAGLSAAAAQAVHRHFGDESRAVIDANPYAVLAVRGVRWAAAESLARAVGVDHLDQRRLVAGAVTAQQQARQRGGHMATATAELVTEARRLLSVDAADARRSLDLAEEAGELAFDDALWWLRADLLAERGVAEEIARLLAARSRLPRVVRDHQPAEELTAEQRAAVSAALHRPVSVLTGGPGTGKTRTVTAIVAACEAHELPVALCAPTGRAAKRMEELTGHPATTVHRLLEARGRPGAGFSFGYGALRRLPHDVVVADEWSMADTRLAWALLQAVADGSHVLLVGDADQLPSVGAGAVLRDLLAVDALAATRLTHVHRQAAASRIVTLAHQINAGAVPPLSGRDNDVFVVAEQPLRIAQRVAEIVAVRAPDFYGCAPTDVQVLAPMYRGPAGVDAVNQALKQRLNPTAGRRGVGGFHEGDRVVQTRNDAELDVANGDIGEVVVTDAVARTLEVAFPHGNVAYPADRTADLALGWCLTVHKAQGAEWPVVVLICDPAHRTMLNRDLVYTAVTRARLGLLLVGDARLVVAAAGRAGSGARLRRTRLAQRLAVAVKPVEAVVEIP